MKKIAFFVEGRTELHLVDRLLTEVAGENGIDLVIEAKELNGRINVNRKFVNIFLRSPSTGQAYYALIVDCRGDSQVISRIHEERTNLLRNGYESVVALRDVRPQFSLSEVPRFESTVNRLMSRFGVPVHLVLGILETEAWFIAESSHFAAIHPDLTPAVVCSTLGYDPAAKNMCEVEAPADDLDRVYSVVGFRYRKPAKRTIAALNIAELRTSTASRFQHLDQLINVVKTFLAVPDLGLENRSEAA